MKKIHITTAYFNQFKQYLHELSVKMIDNKVFVETLVI